MNSFKALSPQVLYTRCDPEQLGVKTTEDLPPLEETLGQGRAVAAVQFGVGIEHEGYNLFCLGPTGIGKHSFIRQFLEETASQQPTPSDWCYVNNFDEAQKPHMMELPAGAASALQADIDHLIDELRSTIPAAFESDDYRARKQVIEDEVKERQGKAFEELRRKAQEKGIAVVRTPTGIVFAPMKDGEILVKQGEADQTLFVLVVGKLAVISKDNEGVDQHVYTMRKEECSGTHPFMNRSNRKATLRALGDATVYTLTRENFEALLDDNPRLAYLVMRALFRVTHANLARVNQESMELTNYITKTHGRY